MHGLPIERLGTASRDKMQEMRQAEQMIDQDIQELSREQLAELATKERALRLSKEEECRRLEEELLQLKKRTEEREDLWLKALSTVG